MISIIVPSYNRINKIPHLIKSIKRQTYLDWELIIVDDGSVDDTKKIIKNYISDSRIKYLYQKNSGVCSARNKGALMATGKYLIFLDSDDSVEMNWLNDFFNSIKSDFFDIVYCNVKMVFDNGNIKYIDAYNPYGKQTKNKILGSDLTGSWIIKKSLFFKVGLYDENIKFGENNELRIRLQQENIRIGIVEKFNFIYNVSSDGGGKNQRNKLNSLLYILDKHKGYYTLNKNTKKLFLQSAAVSAVRIGEIKKANELFGIALRENRGNIKLWIQYLLSANKYFSQIKWKSINS